MVIQIVLLQCEMIFQKQRSFYLKLNCSTLVQQRFTTRNCHLSFWAHTEKLGLLNFTCLENTMYIMFWMYYIMHWILFAGNHRGLGCYENGMCILDLNVATKLKHFGMVYVGLIFQTFRQIYLNKTLEGHWMLDMLLKMSLNVIVLIDVKFVIMTQINDV